MLAAIHHVKVDRVPTDIWATAEVWEKLSGCLGSPEQIRQALHIDGMASTEPTYVGPPLAAVPEGETVNFWGMRYRSADYGTGRYREQCFHPLAHCRSIEDLERYPWPKADWFDFSSMPDVLRAARETQVVLCGYMAPFYYHNLLRGLETSLVDPVEDPMFTRHLVQRISDFFYEYHYRMFETCRGLIDLTQVTDDLGCQTGPLIGLETYRTFYRDHHRRFINLAKSFGIKIFHHDDGAMRTFLPDLVALGIDILNPIQWVCPQMDREALKRDFGTRICFHGGVENQKILPFGTPDEVRAEVRHCIDTLGGDGTGYILAPCHNLQSVTPVENILAMYDEAYRCSQ